jgi:hypothetical protein
VTELRTGGDRLSTMCERGVRAAPCSAQSSSARTAIGIPLRASAARIAWGGSRGASRGEVPHRRARPALVVERGCARAADTRATARPAPARTSRGAGKGHDGAYRLPATAAEACAAPVTSSR